MGPQHTSSHISFLTFPYISPYLLHTFLHLLSYLFPHLPFLPPHPNTLSYTYPHISPHLLKVWRSKLPCDEVTLAKLLATAKAVLVAVKSKQYVTVNAIFKNFDFFTHVKSEVVNLISLKRISEFSKQSLQCQIIFHSW